MTDLPPRGGEQSLIVLQATIAHLKKQVQVQVQLRRKAERDLADIRAGRDRRAA